MDVSIHDAICFQLAKLASQRSGRDPVEQARQFAESLRAIQQVVDDEHFPTSTDGVDGVFDRAADSFLPIASR